MQPKGEAQRDEEYYFKAICCQRYFQFVCYCDSLCFENLHCPLIKRLERALPGDKAAYFNIKSIKSTQWWEHKVPSLRLLAYGATKTFYWNIPSPIHGYTLTILNREAQERKNRKQCDYKRKWVEYLEYYNLSDSEMSD